MSTISGQYWSENEYMACDVQLSDMYASYSRRKPKTSFDPYAAENVFSMQLFQKMFMSYVQKKVYISYEGS